jgi:hypothetical protein
MTRSGVTRSVSLLPLENHVQSSSHTCAFSYSDKPEMFKWGQYEDINTCKKW